MSDFNIQFEEQDQSITLEFEQIGGGAVKSVNGKTGVVVLDADDVGAYTKPSGGIPKTDLASTVQTSLGKADTAYQKPSGGIPANDIASGVVPAVDNTLTVSGAAADAKKVGDEISTVKDGLNDIWVGNVPFDLVPNQYVKNTDGSFATYNGWSRTDYIYVGDLSEITIEATVQSEYNFLYGESKTPIRYFVTRVGANKIVLGSDVKYIALSNTTAAMNATVIKVDATRTETFVDSIDATQEAITRNVSKNVLRLKPKVETSKGITVTVTEDTIRVQGTATGNAYFFDFFNVSDFVGSFTFGVTELSGNGFRTGAFLIQIPYSSNISSGQSKYFSEAPQAQLIAVSGKTIDTTIRFWANKGWTLYDYEPSMIYKVPNSALESAEYSDGDIIYKCPDIADTVYRSELYYGISDGIITFNGELTGGFTLNLPSVVLTGYNTVNIEVIEGSYTGNLYLYLPTGESAFLTSLSASTQRLEYFDGTEKTVAIYAPSGDTFTKFRFRLWITKGLSNKPYNAAGYSLPVQDVVACTSAEYNTPSYARIDDGILYNVFGNKFSACKNGMISRTNTGSIAKFALLADLHYTDSEAFYTRIYKKISDSYGVDFCLMLGDVIDSGYYHKPTQYQQQMTQFRNSIKYLGCPNYPFNGNHDDDVKEFAHHGVVDYGIIRFVYLWADYDGTSEGGKVRPSELTWLENQLSQSIAKINIIMCHYSISTDSGFNYQLDADSRTAITALANEYNVLLYLNGHEHDHSVSVGTAGTMTDVNLPNGKYAYCICEIDANGDLSIVVHKSDDDTVLKTINVSLLP